MQQLVHCTFTIARHESAAEANSADRCLLQTVTTMQCQQISAHKLQPTIPNRSLNHKSHFQVGGNNHIIAAAYVIRLYTAALIKFVSIVLSKVWVVEKKASSFKCTSIQTRECLTANCTLLYIHLRRYSVSMIFEQTVLLMTENCWIICYAFLKNCFQTNWTNCSTMHKGIFSTLVFA